MKLNYKRTLLVGLAFLSICAFWQLYDNVVPLILKNTFDIPDDIAGVIMALDNVLALFLLPLFGKLSDRCHSRLGKRRPFIVSCAPISAVLFFLIPVMSKVSLPATMAVIILFVFSMSLWRAPVVALMPDLTPTELRSEGNAVINYTDAAVPYTRIIEHKHFNFGTQEKTVISREYSSAWAPGAEPYYPVNNDRNNALAEEYLKMAAALPDTVFGGRLGLYRYLDMDATVALALQTVEAERGRRA